jgi:hypothetical protein
MGVDYYPCCACGGVGSDADDHARCEVCRGFICGCCIRAGDYAVFCTECRADCECNAEGVFKSALSVRATGADCCGDCLCKHECVGGDALAVLCPTCADPRAPTHTDSAILAYALELLQRTRESLVADMPPPPDARHKRPHDDAAEQYTEEERDKLEDELAGAAPAKRAHVDADQ